MTSIRKAMKVGKRKYGIKKITIVLRDKDGKRVKPHPSVKRRWRRAIARFLNKE